MQEAGHDPRSEVDRVAEGQGRMGCVEGRTQAVLEMMGEVDKIAVVAVVLGEEHSFVEVGSLHSLR